MPLPIRRPTVYARLVKRAFAHPGFFFVKYKIAYNPDQLYTEWFGPDWRGPFRDETDAESAAVDEAKSRGLELEWVD